VPAVQTQQHHGVSAGDGLTLTGVDAQEQDVGDPWALSQRDGRDILVSPMVLSIVVNAAKQNMSGNHIENDQDKKDTENGSAGVALPRLSDPDRSLLRPGSSAVIGSRVVYPVGLFRPTGLLLRFIGLIAAALIVALPALIGRPGPILISILPVFVFVEIDIWHRGSFPSIGFYISRILRHCASFYKKNRDSLTF